MKVLFFGNPLIKGDNLIFELLPKLKKEFPKIDFIEVDPTEELQNFGGELKIIDAVEGIDDVRILKLQSNEEFSRLLTMENYSMHDFDLGYNLKILKKFKKIENVEIICLPMNVKNRVYSQIQLILRKWVAQDMHGS